jgi:hypothetical protein
MEKWIADRVKRYYWQEERNCAITSLLVLAEKYQVELDEQVLQGALALNGAGRFGAQCGLVEGPLVFMGIYGSRLGRDKKEIIDVCRRFAQRVEHSFGSLLCRELRPSGFKADNPPHLCETLTCRIIALALESAAELKLNEM